MTWCNVPGPCLPSQAQARRGASSLGCLGMAYPANPKCQVHSEKTSHLYDKSFFSKKAKFLMKNKEDGQPYDFFGVRGGNRTRTATENRGILVPSKHAYSTWKLLQYYFR
jgi:hypothetical protein